MANKQGTPTEVASNAHRDWVSKEKGEKWYAYAVKFDNGDDGEELVPEGRQPRFIAGQKCEYNVKESWNGLTFKFIKSLDRGGGSSGNGGYSRGKDDMIARQIVYDKVMRMIEAGKIKIEDLEAKCKDHYDLLMDDGFWLSRGDDIQEDPEEPKKPKKPEKEAEPEDQTKNLF